MQAFGRTPLTSISPKKTWEGAIAGLTGCIATSVLLSKIFSWPTSIFRYLLLEVAKWVGGVGWVTGQTELDYGMGRVRLVWLT